MSASRKLFEEFDDLFDAADAEWKDEISRPAAARDTVADREARELSGIGNNRSVTAPVDEGQRFDCRKCGGTGVFTFGYRYVRQGKCHACGGRGFFKTSEETRAKQKAQREASKKAKADRNAELARQFLEGEPEIKAWIAELYVQHHERPSDFTGFVADLTQSLFKYGEWTEKQLATVRKCVVKSAARKAERAKEQAERKPDAAPAFATALQAAFDRVLATGASRKRLRLTIGCATFNRAPDNGKNPGCLYVKDPESQEYLGKITRDGEFWKSRECEQRHIDQLNAIGDDPLVEAQKHGHETGSCSCCGRTLTNPESIENGIGPICKETWGW